MIRQVIASAALSAALFAPMAAQAQYDVSQVVGYWQCAGTEDGLMFDNRVEVSPNGAVSHFLKVESQPGAGPSIDMFAISSGTWTITGSEIVENITSATLLQMTIDGMALPPSQFQQEFSADMQATGTLPIVSITPTEIVYMDGSIRATCSRL